MKTQVTIPSYLVALMLLLVFTATSQTPYNPGKINKRAIALYDRALNIAQEGDFLEGIRLLQEAVKREPRYLDAYLSIAGMYGEMKNYEQAIFYYEKAKAVDSVYFQDYNLPYAINLAGAGNFEKAVTAVEDFLAIEELNEDSRNAAEYRKRSFQFAIDFAKQRAGIEYKFEPKNLGDSVNSPVSEYFPTITLDGQQLIYTRRVNNVNEDFYGSNLIRNQWTESRGLFGNINTSRSEGALTISQDGEWLIFTGCLFPEGYGSCDLYISYLTPDGWSAPENLGRRVNSTDWDSSPSLSPDKRDLYFASTRPGGYGGSDIYVSRRLSNGLWGDPENLGPSVNTAGNEIYPFIHADNQTLYFTSNGHLGYGNDDLFLVKKQPKGVWSKPENLGFPINTIENEGSLVVAADGKTAYYASDRSDSKGGLDIYTFELRSDVRPAKTLWVKGKVYDKNTGKGLPSAVELSDLGSQELLSKVQTDATGNYLLTLPLGKDFAFNVNRRGYLFFSENFPFTQITPDSTYHMDIPLQPIERNATAILHNIFFDVNEFELKPESKLELDKVVALLKENPTIRIQISGHTDNVGKASDNLKLSNNRAQAVVKYLTSGGIEPKRLVYRGFGSQKPVAENTSESGRARNRRTEMMVISL